MQIPERLLNKQLYIAFQCVWLEDGENREYAFKGAYLTQEEASTKLKTFQGVAYASLSQVMPLKVSRDQKSQPLFWNEKQNCWSNEGCYATVSLEEIKQSLG